VLKVREQFREATVGRIFDGRDVESFERNDQFVRDFIENQTHNEEKCDINRVVQAVITCFRVSSEGQLS
jgi:hypothetical protein